MELYDIEIQKGDQKELDALCISMASVGCDVAISKYVDVDNDKDKNEIIKSLRGKWEGYHLVEYATYIKGKTDNDKLKAAYKLFGQSIKKTQSHASYGGGKTPEKPFNIFKGLAVAQDITLMQCIVDFLEYCAHANNGEGLPISIYQDDRHILLASISKKKAYIEDELARLGDSLGSEKSKLDGIHIFWEQPNNEHEQPCCKIEPCIGQKHLSIPNTYSNVDLEQPSTVLGWTSEITEFIGRDKELKKLNTWLNSDAEKSLQVIHGEGGVGKTRLAFEFADSVSEEWASGQAGTDLKGRWYLGEKGVLLIIDYPEERQTTLKQFLKAIYELNAMPSEKRLRVILLSRNAGFSDIVEEEAPRLSATPIHLLALETEQEHWKLVESAWDGLTRTLNTQPHNDVIYSNKPKIPLEKSVLFNWQNIQSIHTTPLMTLSLVYYFFCEPDIENPNEIELTGQSIIRYMTKREIKFIRKEVGYYFGLKKLGSRYRIENVFLLKAVSAINGGFNQEHLKLFCDVLKRGSNHSGIPEFSILNDLNHQNNELLKPITPDILAADFLAYCLCCYSNGNEGGWILGASGLSIKNYINKKVNFIRGNLFCFSRLIYDVNNKLERQLNIIDNLYNHIKKEPSITLWIAKYLPQEELGQTIKPLVISCLQIAVKQELKSSHKANLYVNLSALLDDVKNSLTVSENALEIYEKLYDKKTLKFGIEYARCLLNHANRLGGIGNFSVSLTFNKKSLSLFETLSEYSSSEAYKYEISTCLENLASNYLKLEMVDKALECINKAKLMDIGLSSSGTIRYKEKLASCLNVLSVIQFASGDGLEGLESSIRSVDLYRQIAESNIDGYWQKYHTSLNTLVCRYCSSGDNNNGLAVAIKAVKLCEEVSKTASGRNLIELGESYRALAMIYDESGAKEKALEVIKKSVEIIKNNHNKDSFPEKAALAYTLNSCSIIQAGVGLYKRSLDSIQQSVIILEQLTAASQTYKSDLANTINTLSLRLNENKQFKDAKSAIERSIELYKELAEGNSNRYSYNYAQVLNNYSLRLAEEDDLSASERIIKEAIKIRRSLASVDFRAHGLNLAQSLTNLSKYLSAQEFIDDAKSAVFEAIKIYQEFENKSYDVDPALKAYSLVSLSYIQLKSGLNEDSIRTLLTTIGIYEQLIAGGRCVFKGTLIAQINKLTVLYSENGSRGDARRSAKKAISICEKLLTNCHITDQSLLAHTLLFYCFNVEIHESKLLRALDIYKQIKGECDDSWLLNISESLSELEEIAANERKIDLASKINLLANELELTKLN